METAFYHDDFPSLPNVGQLPDFERYHSHKILGKKDTLSHSFPDTLGTTSEPKLLQGQPATGSNLTPNSTGINNNRSSSLMHSSDMNLLKLSSLELEQLTVQSTQGILTTTSGSNCTGNPFVYRSQNTNEEEGFADGFVRALADLHKQNQLISAPLCPPSSTEGSYQRNIMSAGEVPTYANMSSYNPNQITVSASYSGSQLPFMSASHCSVHSGRGQVHTSHRRGLDAPQIVPEIAHPAGESTSSPPLLSPVDSEDHELIKAERKRLRNRIAASKCRRRKLERISRLEEKVKILKTQNSDLASAATVLREQVAQLKEKVMSHITSGCQIAVSSATVAKRGGNTSC